MGKLNVYTGENGSGLVMIEGMGLYVPAGRHAEIREQRDELRANLEAMRRELTACQSVLFQLARAGEVTLAYADDAKKVLQATPEQCLREVRAAAGRAGFVNGHDYARKQYAAPLGFCKSDLDEAADQYAEQIRQGGAK